MSAARKIARRLPDYDRGAPLPTPAQETVLITDRSTVQELTDRVETDAHTALTRGLAEYMRQLEAIADGGKDVRFKIVTPDFPDAEGGEDYPSAGVWSPSTGLYDATGFAPGKPCIISSVMRLVCSTNCLMSILTTGTSAPRPSDRVPVPRRGA